MATRVVLTGTGNPVPAPDRAGAGMLLSHGDLHLQFDAGRGTIMRLSALGLRSAELACVFVTHHHFDHLIGLPDIAITRWLSDPLGFGDPLDVVAPRGKPAEWCASMLDVWADELELRVQHSGRRECPHPATSPFEACAQPTRVWNSGDVCVSSVLVRHPPVVPAVAYRIETPDGVVVFSGDTIVCPELEDLASGASVLVHEAVSPALVASRELPASVLTYHADTVELGAMAERLGLPTLMLTHLIPTPRSTPEREQFAEEVRHGGFTGKLIVGSDLDETLI